MKVYSLAINNMIYHLPQDFPEFKHEFLENTSNILAVEDKSLAYRFLEIGFTDHIILRDFDENNSYIKILSDEEAKKLIISWQRYAKRHPEALPNYDLYKL